MKNNNELKLKIGRDYVSCNINESNILKVLNANEIYTDLKDEDEVKRALKNPIDSPLLNEIINSQDKVCIITSDITRPCPSHIILPVLIEELNNLGLKNENITIVFGLGSHRKHTEDEKIKLVGEDIYKKIKLFDSDPSDVINMGYTKEGTPVNIFSVVAKADKRICLGNIEMHYFAGYSGGAKAIMPGVSDRKAISANHSKMVKEMAKAGVIDNNPVREDIEDAIRFCSISFLLNVVLDEKKTIVKAFAGHYSKAHRAGCEFLDSMYKVKIPQLADIVIASAGGFPKDINIYQSQKALDNAQHAVRKGGIIILLASSKEGFGEEVFETWLKSTDNSSELIKRIEENFELGGHKAAAIAIVLEKCKIYFVSDLPSDIAKLTFMTPKDNLQIAIDDAFEELGKDSKVIVMPQAGSTLPVL